MIKVKQFLLYLSQRLYWLTSLSIQWAIQWWCFLTLTTFVGIWETASETQGLSQEMIRWIQNLPFVGPGGGLGFSHNAIWWNLAIFFYIQAEKRPAYGPKNDWTGLWLSPWWDYHEKKSKPCHVFCPSMPMHAFSNKKWLSSGIYLYTLGHIHFGNSVAHAFRWFLHQLWTNFLEI